MPAYPISSVRYHKGVGILSLGYGLWLIRSELRDQLINHDVRKIDRFTADYDVALCPFDGVPDPFFNINTDEDIDKASRILSRI